MLSFEGIALPWLAAIFAGAAGTVWLAGARLSGLASEIADRTGLGQAVIGVVLLGFATSLPEVATTTVASAAGNAPMAVNNLLGGVTFQVVVLAIADMVIGKEALTALVPSPKVMLNAVISIVLLLIAAMGAMIGDVELPLVSVGLFPALIAITYVGALWLLRKEGTATGWKPTDRPEQLPKARRSTELSNRRLAAYTVGCAAAILAAGFVLTRSAEAVAAETGLESGLLGLTLLAIATSLPEVSTAVAAVRLRKAELAIGDVLGGNMFDTVLILLVDIIYVGGLALDTVNRASMTMALMGVLLTSFFLIGLIERRDRTILNMGYDSFAVLIVYIGGMATIVATMNP